MKKTMLTAIAAIVLTASATFAHAATPVPASIVTALNNDFRHVSNVEWKETSDYYKAIITTGRGTLTAFYAFNGELIAVSRKLSIDQLPKNLAKEAAKKGALTDVTDLFEMSIDNGKQYYITFTSGDKSKVFTSTGEGWNRYN